MGSSFFSRNLSRTGHTVRHCCIVCLERNVILENCIKFQVLYIGAVCTVIVCLTWWQCAHSGLVLALMSVLKFVIKHVNKSEHA